MSIEELCTKPVATIDGGATIMQAAAAMRSQNVGDLVVVRRRDGQAVPAGIITDRDIVVEVLGQGLDPSKVTVANVMSDRPLTARNDDGILETLRAMSEKGVRRAPIVDHAGRLVGIVAVDNLLTLLAEELGRIARLISQERSVEKGKTEDSFQDEFAT